jgi:hypothetical protein
MAQRLTFASIRTFADSLSWQHVARWLAARRPAAGATAPHYRPVYRAISPSG